MEKKYLILFIVILILITTLLFYFNQTPTSNKNIEKQQDKILEIKLKIESPFSIATLTIFQNGSALYSRNQQGEDEETIYEAGTFTLLGLKTISDLIYKNDFFSLRDKPFTEGSPYDGSTYSISVKAVSSHQPELTDAFVYSVSCYEFNCDKAFLEIKKVITDSFDEEILEVGV